MMWHSSLKRLAQLADFLTTAASFVAAYFIWDWLRVILKVARPIALGRGTVLQLIAFSLLWVLIFNFQKAYSYQRLTSIWTELKVVARTTLIGVFSFFAAFFLFRLGYVSRLYIVVFAFVNFLMLALERVLFLNIYPILRKKARNRKKILVIGTGTRAKKFIEVIEKNLSWGLEIIGLISADPTKLGMDFYGHKVLGTYKDIENILHQSPIDEVVICVSTRRFDEIREVLETCEREGVQVRLNSDFFGRLAKKVRVDHVYGLPIISFVTTPDDELALFIKRLMDIFLSAFVLLALSPLFLIIAISIKLTSKGPIFYKWNVVGLNKKPFRSWKFRTMVPGADEIKVYLEDHNIMKGPVFKLKDDPRVTKIGKFLRKYSLDELPQLWSVLKGDMSLVGPRPAGPHELPKYESWHRRKLSVKPGITCLWQVSGRNRINDFDEWVKLDLKYIENWSLSLDLRILFKTIPAVLRGTGL